MKCLHALSFVPVLLAALASPASGQDVQAQNPPATPRSYLIAVGGAAFNQDFDNAATIVGGEYGERVHRDVFAYATLIYVENLMSDDMRANLVTASTALGGEFRGTDRGLAFTMGAKYMLPTARRLRPYFGGGFGFLNIKRKVTHPTFGDVTETFPSLSGLNDGVVDPGAVSSNKPLGELTVGFGGPFNRRAYFDARYRYGRVFQSSENVDFSQVSAGIGVTF